jgi:predicted phosphodiesterase
MRAPDPRRLLLWGWLVVVAITGSAAGILLVAHQDARVGPVNARFELRPSLSGGSDVRVPPLGSMSFDSHHGPLALNASVVELRADVARSLAQDPGGITTLGSRVESDLRHALIGLVLHAVAGALAGSALLALLVFRSWRRVALAVGVSVAGALVTAGVAAATWHPDSIREPRYTGLLASAPTAIGDAEQIVANFSQYRLALAQLVGNVVDLYDVTSALPTFRPGGGTIAVLHVSDLHLNPAGIDLIASLVKEFDVRAVLDTGDLTDHGTAAEAPFVADLRRIGVPYVYVRGNHDSTETVTEVQRLRDATVLDGTVTSVAGLRIGGVADPRYTPDKSVEARADSSVIVAGEQLASVLETEQPPVDIALVHDPLTAGPLEGAVPLVLAGHRHKRDRVVEDGTLLLVQGSTGGAGLRALEGEDPTPLMCSVLYFDAESHQLQAWDDVTLGGLGTTSVTVQRHLRPEKLRAPAPPAPTPTE